MKKILYIATTADKRNRLDGETIKCRLLRNYLEEINNIKIIFVDTDNWKKHILKLVFLILINFFRCNDIVISSADKGANIVLKFFRILNYKKKIFYFVIGGSLSKNIIEKRWNINTYKKINHIYVESKILKNNLNELGIKNVDVLNNFRKINKFDNKYQKSEKIRFVYFGRVIKEKGIEQAINLVNRLNDEKYKSSLDIYGQCKDDYLDIIKTTFTENIKYHGEIKPDNRTEYEILSQYDVFIFPTEYSGECLPGALIDAYIAGLAIIASNWKYAKEYIEDGKNGYIFKYKDYNDMYKKTIKLIKSNKLNYFKDRSKEMSKKYDLEKVLIHFKKEISEDFNENI